MKIQLNKIQVKIPGSAQPLFSIGDFTVEAGKKILIEGASGKGKTTLLHLIAGLFLPDEGSVFVGDHRFNTLTDEERCAIRRKHMGLIFQKLNLLEHLTALENVLLATGTVDDAVAALESVGLKHKIHARSAVLSLGEQQRVAVARVLAARPQIILADEPTSSLDEQNAEVVINALSKTAKDRTLIIVSHDQRIRRQFKDVLEFDNLVAS